MQIKKIRKELGWSQKRLADELGVSRVSVARWETGARNPSEEIEIKLNEIVTTAGYKSKSVTSEQESVTSEQEIVTSEQESVTSEQEIVTSEQEIVTSEQGIVTSDCNQQIVTSDFVTSESVTSGIVTSKIVTSDCNQSDETLYSKLPDELKALNQWVVWGKGKVPYDAKTGHHASTTNSETWSSFTEAYERYEASAKYMGIGFVFTADDDYCGIDLDHCIDDDGKITYEASDVIDLLDSYSEYSPSGTGIHIIVKGKKKGKSCKNTEKGIEIYDQNRYFTVTGDVLTGFDRVEERQAELDTLYDKTFGKEEEMITHSESVAERVVHQQTTAGDLTDDELIEKAKTAKNGAKFTQLWDGDWSDYYPSQSEADLSLCSMLAFWTGDDHSRVDALFRQSRLMRPKWDEKRKDSTYGADTVATAVATSYDNYEPSEQKSFTIGAPVKERKTRKKGPIKLPESCWRGVFSKWRDVYSPVTEASDDFLFAGLLTVIGSMLGRRCYVWQSSEVYPNIYAVVVGDSAKSRKSSAVRFAEKMLWSVDGQVIFSTGISTSQGLIGLLQLPSPEDLEKYQGECEKAGDNIPLTPRKIALFEQLKRDGRLTYEGFRLLYYEREWSKLLKKTKKDVSSDLIETLTEAYDMDDQLDNHSLTNPISCEKQCVSVIGATTFGKLQRRLEAEEIEGGFANRFMFFTGERKQPLALPPKADPQLLGALMTKLNEIVRERWNNDEFVFTEDAKKLWVEFYNKEFYRDGGSLILDQVSSRLITHTIKMALIYAATENLDPVITADQLQSAIDFYGYLRKSTARVFSDYAGNRFEKLERCILDLLSDGALGRTEIWKMARKKLTGLTTRDLNTTLQNLSIAGLTEIVTEKITRSNGRDYTAQKIQLRD